MAENSKPHTQNACGDWIGTTRGAWRHSRHNEKPCEPCRLARNKAEREYRAANPEIAKRDDKRSNDKKYAALQVRIAKQGGKLPGNKNTCAEVIGTSAGWQRHYWAAEHLCEECKKTNNEHQRAYAAKTYAAKRAGKASKTLRPNSVAVK